MVARIHGPGGKEEERDAAALDFGKTVELKVDTVGKGTGDVQFQETEVVKG